MIGDVFFYQFVDERLDVLHVFGSFGFFGGWENAQFRHVFIVGLNIFERDLLAGDSLLVGSLDDFVINIRKVLNELDGITGVFQIDRCDAALNGRIAQ